MQPINSVSISNSVPFGKQFGTLNCGRNGTELHKLLQIIHPLCHGTKELERWYAGPGCLRYRIHWGPSSFWPILWKPFDFRGQTFSNGQFSCRVAPLWIVVATLFQTCFRPVSGPRKWMHGVGVSACALGSCPQKPPNGLDAVEDMGAGWCVSTPINLSIYRSIYLSICLNQYMFIFYIFI